MTPPPYPPVPAVLSIAGSDNSAGAGIQADLKVFTAFGLYGQTALTCVVAEAPGVVAAVEALPLEIIRQQIRLSLENFPVRAIKTGMLWSGEIIAMVCEQYQALPEPKPALVVDPVMVASSGDRLLQPEAETAYREQLIPLATIVTPNLDEALVLLEGGQRPAEVHAMEDLARALTERFHVPFLLKGGHLNDDADAVDILAPVDSAADRLHGPRITGVNFHGAGCTFSSAIAAGLAWERSLFNAVAEAKRYMVAVTSRHLRWERQEEGKEPLLALNHLLRDW